MTGTFRYASVLSEPLTHNPEHVFAQSHALVHYRTGAIYSFIPKNACTTLRFSLALANGAIRDVSEFFWIHENNGTFAATIGDLCRAQMSFVVLRCPFRRLASAYLDKIVGRSIDYWWLNRKSKGLVSRSPMSFRDFVQMLGEDARYLQNEHWRPQIFFLVYTDYTRWYCVEQFGTAISSIENETGLRVIDSREVSQHATSSFEVVDGQYQDTPSLSILVMKEQGRIPSHQSLYDKPIFELVSAIYRRDIQLYSERVGMDGLLFPSTGDIHQS